MAPTKQKGSKMTLQDLFAEKANVSAPAPAGFWEEQQARVPLTNASMRRPAASTQNGVSAEDQLKAATAELAGRASGGAAGNTEELAALGSQKLQELRTFETLAEVASDGSAKSPASREAAFSLLAALGGPSGPAADAQLQAAAALTCLHDSLSHKDAKVSKAAAKAADALASALGDEGAAKALDGIYASINGQSWQAKQGALLLLGAMVKAVPGQVAKHLVGVVPHGTHAMLDARGEVKKAAHTVMLAACATTPNTDLQPFVPELVGCIVRPDETAALVEKIACKTFVQPIDSGCLAMMVPLLIKGLRIRSSATRRKGCIIVENMAKLVSDPRDALAFLPKLLPDIIKVSEEAADPELRSVAARAHDSLLRVEQAAERRAASGAAGPKGPAPGPRVEGQLLCDCSFSLAYGARILLHNTTLSLIRGHRYGLCGANGAGKSTLMRAIASGQLDGFPSPEELRTVYVEHDIDSSLSEVQVADFIVKDPILQRHTAPSRERVVDMLGSVGFTPELQSAPVVSLSGGWKMKLALARAMLMDPDVLLLDEPTNHLDTTNVQWLEDYLNGLREVSVMVVSHDSGFLDNVTTDIIHYEDKRLVAYPGNLSAFVKVKPEAKAYYDLSQASLRFVFPKPSFLEGIKTGLQSIVKMHDAAFTYPGTQRQVLQNITLKCTLTSRVHCKGVNGAGKSTLIRMLTGETDPTSGTIWRHPNCRIAYVAQHAFHHVEEHLDKTPAQYMWWRYEKGDDKESEHKANRSFTEDQIAKHKEMAAKGQKVPEELLGRRAHRGDFEYEVKWMLMSDKHNSWVTRKDLVEMGFEKQVNDLDSRIAQAKVFRPLSSDALTQHFADFGLDEELSQHSKIRGMSGGQKVKLVLAAAMWNNAHMLVLDEPTNYLDRDSLGALATAIKEFGGAVVMITHSQEMADTVCNETWLVEGGTATVTKNTGPAGISAAAAALGADEEGDPDAAALEEAIREKARQREEKRQLAKEKAAKRAEEKIKKFNKKF